MTRLFISHLNRQHLISLPDFLSSLPWIVGILILVTLLSLRFKRPLSLRAEPDHEQDGFGLETTTTLKGIAVLLLIYHHLEVECVEGETAFRYSGFWAVIIFVFVSGTGLVMKYGLKKQAKGFLKKRTEKLVWSFWLTLLLFYALDYLLLGKSYPWWSMASTFFGVVYAVPPNGPAWFMTFILFLYVGYYFVCRFRVSDGIKPFLVVIMSLVVLCLAGLTRLGSLFGAWVQYLAVFPAALFIAYHSNYVFRVLSRFHSFSRPLFFGTIAAFLLLYHRSSGVSILSWVLPGDEAGLVMMILGPLYLILALVLIGFLLELSRFSSKFLTFLGLYSYEIFLLHMPFMANYDFFLFRKPLAFFLFIYLCAIMVLAFWLRRFSDVLRRAALGAQKSGLHQSNLSAKQAQCT